MLNKEDKTPLGSVYDPALTWTCKNDSITPSEKTSEYCLDCLGNIHPAGVCQGSWPALWKIV